jgi:CBS domain-containing protein
MLAKDLISDIVPIIKTSETGIKALNWMEVFRISHLPVVNNEDFLGLISDTDIYDFNDAEQAIGSHPLSLIRPYVFDNQHIYELIDLAAKLKLTVIPVLNQNKQYIGCVTLHDLVNKFAQLAAASEPGGIIVLEMNVNDYSLSEITQIIEGNDIKILSLYISNHKDSTKIDLTLKLNTTNLAGTIQALERYNYSIKASFLADEQEELLYQERFDSFMNYLDM